MVMDLKSLVRARRRVFFLGAVAVCWGVFIPAAVAQNLAEQVRQLQEADRKRQADLQQLKASNQALQKKLDQLEKQTATRGPARAPDGDGTPKPASEEGEKKEDAAAPSRSFLLAGYTLLGGVAAKQDGLFIRNADDTFNLHVHNRLQMRYAYDHFFAGATRNGLPSFDRQQDRSDFHIAREYLTFNGNAWTKDLYYQVTLEGFTAVGEIVRLRYAWVDYNLLHGVGWADDYSPWRNALTLRAGLWKGRFGREFPASDGQLQLVDRALATQAFNEGRIRGVEAHGSLVYFDEDRDCETGKTSGPGRLFYAIEVMDGINNANQAFNLDNSVVSDSTRFPRQLDGFPAVTGRLQYDLLRGWYTYRLPDGRVVRANDFRFNEANDLAYHEEPALQVGGSYIFQPDDFDAQPPDNPLQGRFFKGKNVHRYEADASFKYRGFSLTGEYYAEQLDARRSSVFDHFNVVTGTPIPANQQDSQFSQGFYVRGGYFVIPRRLEIAGRISGLYADNLADVFTPASGTPGRPGFRPARLTPGLPVRDAWEYTLGVGYYPTGHHYLKIQADCTYITDGPISSEKSEFLSGSHESDLIFRTQLQVEF